MHPWSAIAIAILLSVTVSIAADANGKACHAPKNKWEDWGGGGFRVCYWSIVLRGGLAPRSRPYWSLAISVLRVRTGSPPLALLESHTGATMEGSSRLVKKK